ncbi:MAG: phenylalanine--tRNA ligase subunit alpha [Bacteroidetes bacterium]|nr:phenylalanine--tRNA ligase subunit alpha [Bacteroidota bacterium]
MQNSIEKYINEVTAFVAANTKELEEFRIQYTGKKGVLTDLFAGLKNIAPEDRKAYGQQLNALKNAIEERINYFRTQFENGESTTATDDITLPAEPNTLGSRHPLNLMRDRIIEIFSRIGFSIATGPEIDDDWHNFSALNFPEEHPARDMQDTFFISEEEKIALRTHTSSVQVRVMETQAPPIRVISPGRVYRNEAISARAHCFFHQVEGLYIDEHVSFADMKQTLLYFAQEMFGKDTEIRLRPSYFPFTEPSAEMDVTCFLCNGKGCNVCKYSGWVEIMGCGMVDPAVLENCGIDCKKYSGYAFGMGIERITMLKYGVNDLRIFSENDVRFLRQFAGMGL